MSKQNIFKVLFLSLILSSCGLIEKWKTPETPTDSKTAEAQTQESNVDDLFSKSMSDSSKETALTTGTDAPANTANAAPKAEDEELKSLEAEFSGNTSAVTAKEVAQTPAPEAAKKEELQQVKVEETIPVIKEETPPTIAMEEKNPNAGKVMNYTVQKGETLMQIAFKLYGDIGKWKELKQLNHTTSALRAGMKIKYNAPDKEFVWNPEGTPYLIKTGETLGIISNNVYQTPKKWKKIWENNKPLIKNPNVIFAGFTLYYKSEGMANYVQPKAAQKKIAVAPKEESANVEEVQVEEAISKIDQSADEHAIDLTKEVQSAPIRDLNAEIQSDEQIDEALTK